MNAKKGLGLVMRDMVLINFALAASLVSPGPGSLIGWTYAKPSTSGSELRTSLSREAASTLVRLRKRMNSLTDCQLGEALDDVPGSLFGLKTSLSDDRSQNHITFFDNEGTAPSPRIGFDIYCEGQRYCGRFTIIVSFLAARPSLRDLENALGAETAARGGGRNTAIIFSEDIHAPYQKVPLQFKGEYLKGQRCFTLFNARLDPNSFVESLEVSSWR